MSDGPLLLRSIGVHRMPGIQREHAFTVDTLGPGVNVIFGPNGSGKTTMARALEEILWPGTDRALHPSLAARIDLDGRTWQAEIEGALARWRCDGAESARPDVGPADVRHRYRLALAEMVQSGETDGAFAEQVALAMAGGFDLEEVAGDGGFGTRPRGVTNLRKNVERAQRDLDTAVRAEADLERRRRHDLPDIERDLEEARAAAALLSACARAIEHRDTGDGQEDLERERARLPLERLDACHANDRETLEDLERRRAETVKRRDNLVRSIDEASRQLEGRSIPDDGIPLASLDALAELARALGALEQQRADHQRERPDAAAKRDENLRRLEGVLAPGQVEALSRIVVDDDTEALARAGHRLAADRALLSEARALLPDPDTLQHADDLRILQDGYDALANWTNVPGAVAPTPVPLSLAAALLAILAAALALAAAVLYHAAWAAALLPVALLAWWARPRRTAAAAEDPGPRRGALRAEFERLGVTGPEAWTIDGVTGRMRDLTDEIAEARIAQERRTQHQVLDRRGVDLDRREHEHDARRADLQRRLGIALPEDDAWLPVLTASLRHWQEAHERVVGIDAALADIARRHAARLEEAGRLVEALGDARPTSRDTLDAALERLGALDQIARTRAALRSELANEVEPAVATAQAEWARLFSARGLAEGDVDGLEALLGDLARRRKLDEDLAEARGRAAAAAGPIAAEHRHLLALSREDLEARADTHRRTAGGLEDHVSRQAALERDLDLARHGTSVTDARAALVRAREALEEARREEDGSAVGRLLLDHIGAESREASLPEVFERARDAFARITSGRFTLLAPGAAPDGFRAKDEIDGLEKGLDQLSTGERVQLLLAVRLGFLEHQERYRLPLLLDETLGTSDDVRAGAIMDAVAEIARAGRQVLYFTAQHDEAGKWAGRLEGGDLDFRVIDLAAIRAGGEATLTPLQIRPVATTRIPAPEARGHRDYGAALGVPGLHPFRQGASQVHLWHALDDPDELHAILARNITTIGQFLNYRRHAGPLPPGTSEHTEARIEAAARGLERTFEAWRRGRARPIELQEALDTGAVSATYEERFAALLAEVERDPEALLEALEAGRLTGFRRGNIDRLRAEFEARGVLSDEERLRPPDLEIRLSAEVASAIDDGLIDNAWIRRVVASLPDLGS